MSQASYRTAPPRTRAAPSGPSGNEMILRMVGATGFEPATYGTQNRRATRLRYTPIRVESFRKLHVPRPCPRRNTESQAEIRRGITVPPGPPDVAARNGSAARIPRQAFPARPKTGLSRGPDMSVSRLTPPVWSRASSGFIPSARGANIHRYQRAVTGPLGPVPAQHL